MNLDDILGPRLYLDGVLVSAERRRRLNLIGGPTVTDDSTNLRSDVDFSALKVYLRQLTVVEADLDSETTPGFSVNLDLGAVLTVASYVVGVSVDLVTPFTGGSLSGFTGDIGTSGDLDAIVDGANLFAAAVDGQASSMPFGIARHKALAAGAQLKLVLTPVGDSLAAATAGEATFNVLLAPFG